MLAGGAPPPPSPPPPPASELKFEETFCLPCYSLFPLYCSNVFQLFDGGQAEEKWTIPIPCRVLHVNCSLKNDILRIDGVFGGRDKDGGFGGAFCC